MKKNVLLVTLRSDEGGGPRLVSALADGLRHADMKVFVASPLEPPYGTRLASIASLSGGEHFTLKHRRFSLITLWRLRDFCRKNNVEIVHSHGLGAGLYSRFLPGRVIHQPHGTHRSTSLMGRFKRFVEKALLRLTDFVVYISESEKKEARQLGILPLQFRVIENPLIGEPILSERADGSETGNSKSEIKLGNLARLDPIKRHVGLVALFRNLREKKRELSLSLSIAGEGEEAGALNALMDGITEKLLPFQPNPFGFLSQLDVFVAASRSEGFGLTILEAMACGVPCLVSRGPGHDDFIERGWVRGYDFGMPDSFVEGFNEIRTKSFVPPKALEIQALYRVEVWVGKFIELYGK